MAPRARHVAAPALCAALLIAAGPTTADVSFRGFFSQRFEADLGPDGDSEGSDVSLRSTTDLGTILTSTSPTTTIGFAPGLRGILSTDDDQDNRILPRVNGSIALRRPRHTLTGRVAFVPDFVSASDFNETGFVDRNVIQLDLSANAGLTYRIDPLNSLSLSAFARMREYTEETTELKPNVSFGGGATWSRTLSPLTTGNLSLNYSQFIPRGEQTGTNSTSRSQTASLTVGVQHALSPGFDVSASAGLSFTERSGSTSGNDGNSSVGFVGSLGGSYAATEDTRFTLSLNQSIEPDNQGNPETRTALTAGVSNRINAYHSVGLNIRGVVTAATFDDEEDGGPRIEFSPFYSVALTEDWNVRLGYTLRLEDDSGDLDVSNRLFLTVSRALDFLP